MVDQIHSAQTSSTLPVEARLDGFRMVDVRSPMVQTVENEVWVRKGVTSHPEDRVSGVLRSKDWSVSLVEAGTKTFTEDDPNDDLCVVDTVPGVVAYGARGNLGMLRGESVSFDMTSGVLEPKPFPTPSRLSVPIEGKFWVTGDAGFVTLQSVENGEKTSISLVQKLGLTGKAGNKYKYVYHLPLAGEERCHDG